MSDAISLSDANTEEQKWIFPELIKTLELLVAPAPPVTSTPANPHRYQEIQNVPVFLSHCEA